MLKSIVITNSLGEVAEYKIDGVQPDDTSGFLITSISGLGPGKATINMGGTATADGGVYSSARLEGKNIVIKGLFTGANSIEEARRMSYKFFPIKDKVNIEVMTDGSDIALMHISGYVESNEPDIFSDKSGSQISIVCESAYFEGDETMRVVEGDGSPVENIGDVDTGVKIRFKPIGGDITGLVSITKNSSKSMQTMEFDPSKFDGVVPNTSPTNDSLENLVFSSNDNGDNEYLCKAIRHSVQTATSGERGCYALAECRGTMHVIDLDNLFRPMGTQQSSISVSEEWSSHMALVKDHDRYTMTVVDPMKAVSFIPDTDRDKINIQQNGIASYNGRIHLISRRFAIPGEVYFNLLSHKVWDCDNGYWELMSDHDYLGQEFPKIMGTGSGISEYDFRINGLMEYESKLHLFASERWKQSNIYYIRLCHYIWDDDTNTWDKLLDDTINENESESPITGLEIGFFKGIHATTADKAFSAWIDSNEIHFFYELNNSGSYYEADHHHIIWDQSYGFRYSFDPPAVYYSDATHIHGINTAMIVPFGSTIHILGGYDYYELEPLVYHYMFDSRYNVWRRLQDLDHGYYNKNVHSGVWANYEKIFLLGNSNYSETYTEPANNIKMQSYDTLEICTVKGQKNVVLYRANKKYNVLKSMVKGSEWITVNNGNNYFVARGDVSNEGELSTVVSVKPLFQGV